MEKKQSLDIKKLTYLAVLTAIVFVLQFLPIKVAGTFTVTFVLLPIVIGVALCGVSAGVWLGAVFATAVFATGDAALFLSFDVLGTIVIVFAKGMLAGLGAGGVYKLLEKKNRYLAVTASAVITPIINTGVFFLGCLVFFMDDINVYFGLGGEGVIPFIITALIGFNFIIELAVNILLAPTIYRLINLKKAK